MRQQTILVVKRYIDAVRRNDASDVPLHPEVVGEFPTDTYRGAEAFRQGLEPFARIVRRIEVLRSNEARASYPGSVTKPQ